MNKRTALVLSFLLIFFASTVEGQSKVLAFGAPATGGVSASRLMRIDSNINDWLKKKWTNGAVALIARNGKIVYDKAFGYNDAEQKVPLDKNGIFRIASQTKAITTVAALMLWEEGKFSMDDSVAKFIPGFSNQRVLSTYNDKDTTYTTVPVKRPMTILDLLTHTSGLGYPGIGTPQEIAIYSKNYVTGGVGVRTQNISDVMNRLGKLPLFFQPGEQWKYGLSSDVLGYLIQIWSGKSLEDFFAQRIFGPLGMKDTYFNVPQSKGSRLVNFFIGDNAGTITKAEAVFGGALNMSYPLQKTDYYSGDGGLSSTAYDYAIFLQMLCNEGEYNGVRLLAPGTVRMMTSNQIGDLFVNIGDRKDYKFGYGLSVLNDKGSRGNPSLPGTYAWGGVFSTTFWVDPKEHLLVVFYQQMWGPHMAETQKLFRTLVYQAIVE